MSLLLLTVTLRGVSNKHCLLSLFSFTSFSHMQQKGFLMTRLRYLFLFYFSIHFFDDFECISFLSDWLNQMSNETCETTPCNYSVYGLTDKIFFYA